MDTSPPLSASQETATTTTAPPRTRPGALPRIFSTLLIVAAVASILSTLAFLGYLLVPVLTGGQPRANFVALYATGIIGLAGAEGCQILAVVTLIGQWLSRANIQRKPKELLILLASLIPYVVVIIFLITLIVYLRVRRQNPASPRTQEAAHELKERSVDIFIDAGANTSSSAAGSPTASAPATTAAPSTARPTMRDAIRQVIGPATSGSISQVAHSLVGLTMVGLLLSAVTTAGVVVPSGGLTPLQPVPALAGTWTLTASNVSDTCDPPQSCSPSGQSDLPTQVVIQQSGTHLTMSIPPGPPDPSVSLPSVLYTWKGAIVGNKVNFGVSYSGPITGQGGTVNAVITISLTGSALDANHMRGTYSEMIAMTGGVNGPLTTHQAGDWTATRIKP